MTVETTVLITVDCEVTVETKTIVVGVATHIEDAKRISIYHKDKQSDILELEVDLEVDLDEVEVAVRQEQALEILAGFFAQGSKKLG